MIGYKKEDKHDLCKSHTARSDREQNRCPSKLSKRELEDLYFTVLENNVELKRTINAQQGQIKVLSTKVQRMTVSQKCTSGKENECCANIKVIVNEQKQSIADLSKANERMSERVRVLNMKLCSAKQFLKRSPFTSVSRCPRCSASPLSVKNSSTSIINAKSNGTNKNLAISIQNLDRDVELSTRTVETDIEDQEKVQKNIGRECNENKCRSQIEEFKQKIMDLNEELSKTRAEYSSRVSQLEAELSDLRLERDRSRTQHISSITQLQRRNEQADQMATRLRAAEAKYNELVMEQSIEKRKVAELEMRLKAMDLSNTVAKTIEEHLTNSNQVKNEIEIKLIDAYGSPYFSPRDKSYSRLEVPGETRLMHSDATDQVEGNKALTVSDDSGFIPDSPDQGEKLPMKSLNQILYDRISSLQDQLDKLQSTAEKSKVSELDPPKDDKPETEDHEVVHTSSEGDPCYSNQPSVIDVESPLENHQQIRRRSSYTINKSYNTIDMKIDGPDSVINHSKEAIVTNNPDLVPPSLIRSGPNISKPNSAEKCDVVLEYASTTKPVVDDVLPATKPLDLQSDDAFRGEEGPRRRSATYSKSDGKKTYSVPPRSPDNTDCEISSLTDLPSERDARRMSLGEANVDLHQIKTDTRSAPSPSERMQETLASIAQELERCRELLARHAGHGTGHETGNGTGNGTGHGTCHGTGHNTGHSTGHFTIRQSSLPQ